MQPVGVRAARESRSVAPGRVGPDQRQKFLIVYELLASRSHTSGACHAAFLIVHDFAQVFERQPAGTAGSHKGAERKPVHHGHRGSSSLGASFQLEAAHGSRSGTCGAGRREAVQGDVAGPGSSADCGSEAEFPWDLREHADLLNPQVILFPVSGGQKIGLCPFNPPLRGDFDQMMRPAIGMAGRSQTKSAACGKLCGVPILAEASDRPLPPQLTPKQVLQDSFGQGKEVWRKTWFAAGAKTR